MTLDLLENTAEMTVNRGDKIKVLYLAGWGRSGSTLLSNILGEVKGFVSTGEIYYLWERGALENKVCGCGQPFWDCSFWSSIFAESFGEHPDDEIAKIHAIQNTLHNSDIILSWLPGGKRVVDVKVKAYTPYVEKLYAAIQNHSDCSVIVDASKIPIDAYILDAIPNIELYVLHLVRDPRAVAYSWLRKKHYDANGEYMLQFGPFFSTLVWSAWNAVIDLVWRRKGRYMLVRYEDFIQSPQSTFNEIMKFCDETDVVPPFVSDHVVSLGPNHNVAGNPSRFKTGDIELKADNEWKTKMNWRHRAIVSVFWPFLLRYGYGRN